MQSMPGVGPKGMGETSFYRADVSVEAILPSEVSSSEWKNQVTVAINAVLIAGKKLLELRTSGQVNEFQKDSGELVTSADFASNLIVCKALNNAYPAYGILSEEAFGNSEKHLAELGNPVKEAMARWNTSEFTWVIDPLDGTAAYKDRANSDYGVLIALNRGGETLLGVSYFPVKNHLYFAVKDHGAFRRDDKGVVTRIGVNPELQMTQPPYGISKQIHGYFGELFGIKERDEKGFLPKEQCEPYDCCGVKLCQVAEGSAALFATPAPGIWDWCSGALIVKEAGGFISDFKGEPLDYVNSRDGRMRKGQIAAGNFELYSRMVALGKKLIDTWKL